MAKRIVQWDGDSWEVAATGRETGDSVYCHLRSKTRVLNNGTQTPYQVHQYIPRYVVENAVEIGS